LINGLLLILAKMNQGVAQNPLVHIGMVLLAQIFGSSGWTTRPTWLHKHVRGPLPSAKQGTMWPSMWPNN